MTFHIGQRVICLKTFSKGQSIIIGPEKHKIYTIRAFCPNAYCPALLLHEIHNSKVVRFARTFKKGEPSFAAAYFRPLVDLHEVFSISTKAPKKESLDA